MAFDVICFDDLDLFGRETEDELIILEQDVYHRLFQEQGTNLDDLNCGLGLFVILSGPFDPGIKEKMVAELLKDDRIDATEVAITELGQGRFKVEVGVQPVGRISLLVGPEGFESST